MALDPARIQRYQRQLLLAPIGGPGQEKIAAATVRLRGEAPLCRRYLEGAGVGAVVADGAADLVIDLEDAGESGGPGEERVWCGVVDGRIRVGGEPGGRDAPTAPERAVVEILAAGEALWRILGHPPHVYDFAL